MIAAIKKLFAPPAETDQTEALRTAGALLLLEVAAADFNLSAEEREVLRSSIGSRFGLAGAELTRLIDEAMQQHDVSVSLHEQITLINGHYDAEGKRQLMRDLWTMAYADGELHHYEEAVVRRLADLLYVPHRDFILTKHEVSGLP
jgi:uncharacterized tellurite resistance protein B-like protein